MGAAKDPDALKSASFFIDPLDRRAWSAGAARFFPGTDERTVRDADTILEHVFDLLGSGPVRMGRKIDWHRDFISGASWDPGRRYDPPGECVSYDDPSDVKVPWDLNSFLHLPTLGKAWWYTGNEKYTREFAAEIDDWIKSNPYPRGVNWACAMKVAHRAINWIWGYYFFRPAKGLEPEFWDRLLDSLETHGTYIVEHQEDARPASNHYLLGLAGLFFLGAAVPELSSARRWQRHAVKRLNNEVGIHVYPDGAHYEGSIYYHHFVTEIFLSVLILGRKNGIRFSPFFVRRLEKMLEFIACYTRSHGSAPRIGDADDGRVQILSDYSNWNRLDHRRLLSTGAVIFKRGDFKAAAGLFAEESFWLLGEAGREEFETIVARPAVGSHAFAHGGYYIQRHQDLHLIADCLRRDPNAPTAHFHNSRLSFELSAAGVDFIVDPGTYVYTADPRQRDLFRSTAFHNTVTIDGREQNLFRPRRLWDFQPGGRIRVRKWETTPEYDLLDAEYIYRRRGLPGRRVGHRRRIYLSRIGRFWVVQDVLSGRGRHSFCFRLHFDPGIRVEIGPGMIEAGSDGARLYLFPVGEGPSSSGFTLGRGQVSKRYGHREEAPVVSRRGEFSGRGDFGIILIPGPLREGVVAAAKSAYEMLAAPDAARIARRG